MVVCIFPLVQEHFFPIFHGLGNIVIVAWWHAERVDAIDIAFPDAFFFHVRFDGKWQLLLSLSFTVTSIICTSPTNTVT